MEEYNFNCDFCGKAFQSINNLALHLRLHTKEIPFKCAKCDKFLYSERAVTRHFKGKRCNLVKSFKLKSNLHEQPSTSSAETSLSRAKTSLGTGTVLWQDVLLEPGPSYQNEEGNYYGQYPQTEPDIFPGHLNSTAVSYSQPNALSTTVEQQVPYDGNFPQSLPPIWTLHKPRKADTSKKFKFPKINVCDPPTLSGRDIPSVPQALHESLILSRTDTIYGISNLSRPGMDSGVVGDCLSETTSGARPLHELPKRSRMGSRDSSAHSALQPSLETLQDDSQFPPDTSDSSSE